MAKEKKDAGPKMNKYRVLYMNPIHVNGQPRQPFEEFEEVETQEMLNLTQHKYIELVK